MAQQPDVRVRLSAEGVQDVVAALRRIRNEGEQAATGVEGAFGKLKNLVGAIGIGVAVAKMVAFTKSAIDAADAVGDLASATGASAEQISVYAFAAREAGADQATLEKGIIKLSKSLDALKGGDKGITETFKRIGLTAKDFQGLNFDQSLALITDRLSQYEGSTGKVAVATEIFGKNGTELLEVLDNIGNEGLPNVTKRAREAGAVLSDEMTQAANDAKKALGSMQNQATAVANQLVTGLVPAVSDSFSAINKAATGPGVSGFKTFGEGVGTVVKAVTFAVIVLGKFIGNMFGEIVVSTENMVERMSSAARNLRNGEFRQALQDARAGAAELSPSKMAGNILSRSREDAAGVIDDLFGDKPATAGTTPAAGGGGGSPKLKIPNATANGREQASQIAKARLDFLKAQLQNEQKLLETQNKLTDAIDKARYNQGLIDLKTYYGKRRDAITAEGAKEISVLQATRDQIAKLPVKDKAEGVSRQKELADIDAEIQRKRIEQQTQLTQLAEEQRQAEVQGREQLLQLDQQIAEAQGRGADAARIALDEQITKTRILLQQQGLAAAEVEARLARMRSTGENTIQFDALRQQLQNEMAQLEAQKAAIQNRVAADQLFPMQAEQQIIALEQQRLPLLQQIAAEMERIAAASGNQGLVIEAQQTNNQVQQLTTTVTNAGNAFAGWKAQAQDAFTNGLSNFLSSGILQAKSLGDAFRQMAAGIVQDLQRMAAQALAAQIFKSIAGGFAGGGVVRASTGGFIAGPGTSTSDSIPALLSDGEFVMRASVVSQPGMLEMLTAMNRGATGANLRGHGPARFADGGAVAGGGITPAASGGTRIVNVLDPALAGDYLNSSAGEKVVMNLIQRNAGAVKSILKV